MQIAVTWPRLITAATEGSDEVGTVELAIAIPIAFAPSCSLARFVFGRTEYRYEVATVELAIEVSVADD